MSEKSYKPTQKRLREARKRGEVVRSRELTALGAFLAVWLYLWVGAQFMLERLRSIAERALDALGQPWLPQVQSIVSDMFWTVVPLLGLSIAGGVLFASVQTRGVFSMTPITPNFARINP
jgi:type III secretion protein U